VKGWITAFLTGGLFGFGLAWSGMTNPARVLAFLDVTGDFDPTLALVMGGALAVTVPAFAWILRRPRPLLQPAFRLPTATRIDAPLLGGAALFGLGWGLAGLCPGPAIAGLVTGSPSLVLFCLAMVAGQWLAGRLSGPR
jgi:uncharacterized membrane protein YedE/YeeE